MSVGGTGNGNAYCVKEDQAEHRLSSHQEEQFEPLERAVIAQIVPVSAKNSTLQLTPPAEDGTEENLKKPTKAAKKKARMKPSAKISSRTVVDEILGRLAEVERHMSRFREYIKTQKDDDKPLYQWANYSGYPALDTAVSELDEATSKFKRVQLPQEYVAASVARAMDSSTTVSKAASYALAAMNMKTAKYMEEMETSTLSEEAKVNANALITEELQKLMEHSTHATERVWVATDLLRKLEEKQARYKDWAWSAAATVITAFIGAAVGILTAHLYGPEGLDLIPQNGRGQGMYGQVLDLVQRTQAATNLTSELYTIKMQDIDQRYNNLAALSESHGLRIDNLVEGLGPPNEKGIYYLSTPQRSHGEICKDVEGRLQKVSNDANRQMQRLHEEMQIMRKNMNRMDIRLTSGLDKVRKE